MFQFRTPVTLPLETDALPGRPNPIPTADRHFVNGRSIKAPFPPGMETALFGLGCFWGAERLFWVEPGVHVTAVGYAGGVTPNPTYEEVRSGLTGHSEIVLVAYDPGVIDYTDLAARFFEGHDPTQGMRQGDDIGTQYRSCIFGSEAQLAIARGVKTAYQLVLEDKGFGAITTEILTTPALYYAEADHQQYMAKNPDGSCGLRGTGVACPIGSRAEAG